MANKKIEYLWHINNDEMAQFWAKGGEQKYLSAPTAGMPKQFIGKANNIYAPAPAPYDILGKRGILNAGKTIHLAGYYHSRQRKDYAVLLFLQSGKISVKTETGARIAVKSGQTLVVPAGLRCDEYINAGKVSLFWLHLAKTPALDFGAEVKSARTRNFGRITAMLEMYLEEVYSDGRSLAMLENIADILSEFLRRDFGAAARAKKATLLEYAEKIRQNPAKKWNRIDAARAFQCPPNALDKLCQKTYGLTFAKFVRDMRIKRAAEMLESGVADYRKIARAAGYASVSALSKAFKAERGAPLSRFMRGS